MFMFAIAAVSQVTQHGSYETGSPRDRDRWESDVYLLFGQNRAGTYTNHYQGCNIQAQASGAGLIFVCDSSLIGPNNEPRELFIER